MVKYFKILYLKMQKSPIGIHPLFLLLGVFLFALGRGNILLIYVILSLCHEGSHWLVAKRLGYVLTKIRLMPFGAVLEADNDEFNSKDEILISVAGPAFNFMLCIFIVAVWWIDPGLYDFTIDIMVASLSCGLFNLIPIFPLDGGRIILAIVSYKHSRENAAKLIKRVTLFFGVLIILLFFITLFISFNYSFLVVGVMFIVVSLSGENCSYQRITFLRSKVKKTRVGLPIRFILLNKNTTCFKAYLKISALHYLVVKICDEKLNVIGEIDETDLTNLVFDGNCNLTLERGMNKIMKKNCNKKLTQMCEFDN